MFINDVTLIMLEHILSNWVNLVVIIVSIKCFLCAPLATYFLSFLCWINQVWGWIDPGYALTWVEFTTNMQLVRTFGLVNVYLYLSYSKSGVIDWNCLKAKCSLITNVLLIQFLRATCNFEFTLLLKQETYIKAFLVRIRV